MKNLIKIFAFMALCVFSLFANTSVKSFAAESSQYATCTSVNAAHILVDTKAQADLIKSKIDSGESFETMAKKYSKCPSGQDGGNLGYFRRGQMVREFETAAFSLPVGKVSEPVQTSFGWHLIKVYDKK